jgi:hypothetical protein
MIKSVYGNLRTFSGLNMNNLSSQDYNVKSLHNYLKLIGVRELMDKHMTYDKERMLNVKTDTDGTKNKPERFIWSYIIRPVRKGYEDQ